MTTFQEVWEFLTTPSWVAIIFWAVLIVNAILLACWLGKYIIDKVYADAPLSNDDNYFI